MKLNKQKLPAKSKVSYYCTECGGENGRWQGQCPACQAWNTLVEAPAQTANRHTASAFSVAAVQTLSDIRITESLRMPSGVSEFDRVLGGGLVEGGVVLLGGDPGIGKSTLLIQALAHLSRSQKVLYVSAEESSQQVALRAQRLQISAETVKILAETELETIFQQAGACSPAVMVVDSIQTIYSSNMASAPGSVAQVRECASQLTRYAKDTGTVVIMVGHVTKEGSLAGPRVLEHIVDTVLYFEGDAHSSYRLVRAFKNRFGAINELGVFAMTDKGLRAVTNPSALFLSQHEKQVPGSCILVTQEGSRPLLVEIQALVDDSRAPNPRRLTVGLEQNRLAMLLAVLHRHGGIPCLDQDVFVNAVGGVRVTEPASDLAVLLAVLSSLRDKPLPEKLVVFGELGLTGEIRPVQRGQERLKEAAYLGFTHALIPRLNQPKQSPEGMRVHAISRLEEAVEYCLHRQD